jgi:hypothetical protein
MILGFARRVADFQEWYICDIPNIHVFQLTKTIIVNRTQFCIQRSAQNQSNIKKSQQETELHIQQVKARIREDEKGREDKFGNNAHF